MISEIIRRLEAERDKAEAEFNATEHPFWMARYCASKNAYEKAISIVKEVRDEKMDDMEKV